MTTSTYHRSFFAPIRASLRPALRELRFHKLRSLAAILLIALPVALTTFMMADDSAHTRVRSLYSTNLIASYYGGSCEQDTETGFFSCVDATGDVIARNLPSGEHDEGHRNGGVKILELVGPALPSGASVSAISRSPIVVSTGPDNSVPMAYSMVPNSVSEPLKDHVPAPGEIALDKSDAETLGVAVGDSVTVWAEGRPNEKKTLTVSELTPANQAITSEPLIAAHASPTVDQIGTVSVFTSHELTWSEVKQFNRSGFVLFGDEVSALEVPESEQYQQFTDLEESLNAGDGTRGIYESIAWFALFLTAAIVVLLLISPVFSISASKNTSIFALMRSQGASKRDVFRAVIFYGLVVGIIGTAIGWLVGIAASFATWRFNYPTWAFEPDGIWIVLIPIVAVIGSVIVSMLPATLASRIDIIAGITGSPTGKLMRWRHWMWAGPILLIIAVLMYTAYRAFPLKSEGVALYLGYSYSLAPVFALIGLALSAPALAYVAGSFTKPLALRLAGRELRRNTMRTVPVIAAIAGLVFISSTTSSSTPNYYAHQAEQLDRVFSQNFGVISEIPRWSGTTTDAEELAPGVVENLDENDAHNVKRLYASSINRAREDLGPGRDIVVYSTDSYYSSTYSNVRIDSPYTRACSENSFDPQSSLLTDVEYADRCAYENMMDYMGLPSSLGGNLIADESILEIFHLEETDQHLAREALRAGGILAAKHHGSSDSTRVTVEEYSYDNRGDDTTIRKTPKNLPVAAVLPDGFERVVFSFGAAEELEITAKSSSVLLLSSADDRTIANTAKKFESGKIQHSYVPLKNVSDYATMVTVPLGAAGIVVAVLGLVIALSLPHIRLTFEQYSAMGASQRTLRRIGSLYTGLMATVAVIPSYLLSILGSTVDYQQHVVAANGVQLSTTQSYSFADNWVACIIFLIGIPLLAFLIGWFTTPKVSMKYRQD